MPDSILPFAARQTSDGVSSLTANITVGNSAAEAVVMAYAIPANSMVSGTTYDLTCSGFGGSTATTLTLRLRYGGLAGVVLCTVVITAAATTSPQGFWFEGSFTCRTPGSTGSGHAQAMLLNEFGTTLPIQLKLSEANAAAVIDTTTQKDLVFTAQWGAAAVGATITATNGLVMLAKA